MRQAVLLNARPLGSAVSRDVDSAARPAAKLGPGVHFHLPHPREEYARIVRIHCKTGAPDVLSGKKNTLPVLAAVHCAVHAAFLLRACRASKRTCKNDVRIRGMHDNSADAPRFFQAHIGPSLPCIRGLIDSVADYIAVTDYPSLARSSPDYARVRRGDRQRTNRSNGLLVKDGHPAIATVR